MERQKKVKTLNYGDTCLAKKQLLADGKVKVNDITVRVIGADPAPKGGIDYYDGQEFKKIKEENDWRNAFENFMSDDGVSLIAWDAPISFDKKHGFYSRPVERTGEKNGSPIWKWIKKQEKKNKIQEKAVSIRAFAGCPHWTVSCERLGMPYGKPLDRSKLVETRDEIFEKHDGKVFRPIIEVHPAVSMAVWWVAKNLGDMPFPKYKGSKKQKDAVKIIRKALQTAGLISDEVEKSKEDDVWDDNQLDAWVAWKMGVDFLTGDAVWVGSPQEGGFVLPKEANNPKLMGTENGLAKQMKEYEK